MDQELQEGIPSGCQQSISSRKLQFGWRNTEVKYFKPIYSPCFLMGAGTSLPQDTIQLSFEGQFRCNNRATYSL